MRTLTNREKLLIRIALVGLPLAIVISLIVGQSKKSGGLRGDYNRLLEEAEKLKRDLKPYDDKIPAVKKLMETFRLDPAKLSRASVVAEASSAIQKAASSGGVQFGPIRESPGRPSASELASIKLEGSGQLPAVMAFMHRLGSLGYPMIIGSVQISSDNKGPGIMKLSLTIIILDFEQWKKEGKPNA